MVNKKSSDVKGDQEGVVEFCIDHVLNMPPQKQKQFHYQRVLGKCMQAIIIILEFIRYLLDQEV